MKNQLIIGLIAVILATSTIALAVKPESAGKSPVEQLYLWAKDPVSWEIIDGAWGKMTYNTANEKFIFNGHQLTPYADYQLINYAREGSEWPPTINCLGMGTADEYGDVHIMGSIVYEDLGYDTTPDTGSEDGYKIWLVPSASADCDGNLLVGWDPADYLFENNLI